MYQLEVDAYGLNACLCVSEYGLLFNDDDADDDNDDADDGNDDNDDDELVTSDDVGCCWPMMLKLTFTDK